MVSRVQNFVNTCWEGFTEFSWPTNTSRGYLSLKTFGASFKLLDGGSYLERPKVHLLDAATGRSERANCAETVTQAYRDRIMLSTAGVMLLPKCEVRTAKEILPWVNFFFSWRERFTKFSTCKWISYYLTFFIPIYCFVMAYTTW